MTFIASLLSYDDSLRNTILDYTIKSDNMHFIFLLKIQCKRLQALKPEDSFFEWTSINSNYSLTGYEMVLSRNSLKYIVNYYLPSGLFVLGNSVSFFIIIK